MGKSFFDSNPIGRIQTRLAKDIAVLDLVLPPVALLASFAIFRTISVSITIIYLFPFISIFVFFALICMSWVIRKGTTP